jgi:TonB family protein
MRLGLASMAVATWIATSASDPLPQPPYPGEALAAHQSGAVLIKVQFDAKGNVASCNVLHSAGMRVFARSTRDFIEKNWHDPKSASTTRVSPFYFNASHPGQPPMLTPSDPQLISVGTSLRLNLTLDLTVDPYGFVAAVAVKKSSGNPGTDLDLSNYVQSNWLLPAHAGRVVELPIHMGTTFVPSGSPQH